MIRIDVPASLCCVAIDCAAKHPVELLLMADGSIGWKAPTDARGWQLVKAPDDSGPVLARCPQHVFADAELKAPKEDHGHRH